MRDLSPPENIGDRTALAKWATEVARYYEKMEMSEPAAAARRVAELADAETPHATLAEAVQQVAVVALRSYLTHLRALLSQTLSVAEPVAEEAPESSPEAQAVVQMVAMIRSLADEAEAAVAALDSGDRDALERAQRALGEVRKWSPQLAALEKQLA